MKKIDVYFFMSLVVGILSLPLEGVSDSTKTSAGTQVRSKALASNVHEQEDEYDIMERDEIDDTDVLAIPFDESEVEDEEQIDLDEKKDVFHLPHSR